jgi:hypothetical protein
VEGNVSRSRGIPRPARQILSYFLRNPSAADSLEDIARWRLADEVIYQCVLETETSLHWLLKNGFLVEISESKRRSGRSGSEQRRLFSLNREKVDEAQSIVAALTARPPESGKPTGS